MSTDHHDELDRTLIRLYDELGAQAGQVRPAPAEWIRERGDARNRNRAALAAAAAVLVAAAALGGARLTGDGEDRVVPAPPVPLPGPTVSEQLTPTVPPPTSVPATSDPATSDPASSAPSLPTSIPARAFLTRAQLGAQSEMAETDQALLRNLCDVDLDPEVGARRSGYLVTRSGDVPLAYVVQEVDVYRSPGRAETFMRELRSVVRNCATPPRRTGGTVRSELVDAPDLADEAILVRHTMPSYDYVTGEPRPGSSLVHWSAAIRHGDTVTVLSTDDYEVSSVEDEGIVRDLMRHATEQIVAWRG